MSNKINKKYIHIYLLDEYIKNYTKTINVMNDI